MSLSILADALNLEADAADLRVQASILKIKCSEYPSRTAANEDIQLHHASLTTPKHLVAIDNASEEVKMKTGDMMASMITSSGSRIF